MNLSTVLWTALPFFSSCDLHTERASLLYRGKLSYSFISLDWLPTFYPLHFQSYKISLRAPLIWKFFLASLPLGHLHPFHHSLFMSISLPSLGFSGSICSLSKDCSVNTARAALGSLTPFTFHLNFSSSIIMFSFFTALFIMVGHFSLLITHFCKKATGCITGRQECNTTIWLLFECELIGVQWPVTTVLLRSK